MKNTFLIYGTLFCAILKCVVNENASVSANNGSDNPVQEKLDVFIESDGITPSGVSLNVVEGDTINLLCKLKGEINDQLTISWFRGEEDSENVVRLDVGENANGIVVTDTGNTSSLVISSAKFDHRDYYTCEMISDKGKGQAQVLVRVKDKLAALWPFLGIVGEVVILCAVIFIYEKRRSKPDFQDSETDNAEGKSPQTSAKGQELRQRKQ